MQNYEKEIYKFIKFKNKINSDIIIMGGGRWTKVLIIEIIKNFPNIKIIFILTKNKKKINICKKKKKFDNLFLIENLKIVKSNNIKFAIVANKNKDHYDSCKKLLNAGCNILVEKPLSDNIHNFKKLILLSKKKKRFIILGMQFFYSYFFHFIKSEILKRKKIKELNVFWFDRKNEARHGEIKKYDKNLSFFEDIFYHIYSIIFLFLDNGKIKANSIFKKGKNKVSFIYDNTKVTINFSRLSKFRKRILKFELIGNDMLEINFSNFQKIKCKIFNKDIKIPKKFMVGALKYELFHYLISKKYKKNKIVNDIRNLKNFIINLSMLKNLKLN